jgi:hypothetical protein
MKTMIKAALAATVATGLFASPALAAPAGTGTFSANAKIVKAVTLENDGALDFGTTVMNSNLVSATVSVGNAEGDAAVCSSDQLSCQGGAPAKFLVTGGSADQDLQISFPLAPTELEHSALPGETVGFQVNTVDNVTLDKDGAATFYVGGTITVVAATVDGDYTANVNVNANYL